MHLWCSLELYLKLAPLEKYSLLFLINIHYYCYYSLKMSSSSDGWGRLAGISDADIRGLDEEAVDEYYVFLLTNKLSSEELLTNDPLKLTKLVNNIQTVVRVSSLSLSLSLIVSLFH